MAEAWALLCIGAASPADRRVVVPAALGECIGEAWDLMQERVRLHLRRCTAAVRRAPAVALRAIGTSVTGLALRVSRVLRGRPAEARSGLTVALPALPMAVEPLVPRVVEGQADLVVLVFTWRCEELEFADLPALGV